MNHKSKRKQTGQVIIILLLLMLVVLSIGLAIAQRSITDVSNSTQAEQATRAFSAAEAGIQKALSSPLPLGYVLPLDNNSSAVINTSGYLPYNDGNHAAIEYPKIGRETTAQFWFVDPAVVGPPVAFYNPPTANFDLFYGNESTTDLPAVEVTVVMQSGNNYYVKPYYFDSSASRTALPNGNRFTPTLGCGSKNLPLGILGSNRKFYCQQTVGPVPDLGGSGNCGTATCKLILARVRFLYITQNHSLALAPLGASNNSLPPQVQIYSATGTSGQSQKQIQAFKVRDVVLPWFDFAIFSTNEIRK